MIDGVVLRDLKLHQDDRGYLMEIWRESWDVVPQLKQIYVVEDADKGIIRAFHKHQTLIDIFCILHGVAKFGLHDDRKDSPTYKETDEYVLSARKPQTLYVPPGVYHGWASICDPPVILLSLASHEYNHKNPDEERVKWDSFPVFWKPRFK